MKNEAKIERAFYCHNYPEVVRWMHWPLGPIRNTRTTRLGRRAIAFGRKQAGSKLLLGRMSVQRDQRIVFSATHGNRGMWLGAGYALHWATYWGNGDGYVAFSDETGTPGFRPVSNDVEMIRRREARRERGAVLDEIVSFFDSFETPAGVGSRADERPWSELFTCGEMLS